VLAPDAVTPASAVVTANAAPASARRWRRRFLAMILSMCDTLDSGL